MTDRVHTLCMVLLTYAFFEALWAPALDVGLPAVPVVLGGAALAGWAYLKNSRTAGILALLTLGGLAYTMLFLTQRWDDPGHGKHLPWLVMLSWVATRNHARPTATFADASAGFIGACYTLAGLSKLWSHGLDWAGNGTMAMLVRERSYFGGPFDALRMVVSDAPMAMEFAGWIAIAIELGASLMVFRPLRLPIVLAIISMHLSIGVTLGYWYSSWWYIMIAVVILTHRADRYDTTAG